MAQQDQRGRTLSLRKTGLRFERRAHIEGAAKGEHGAVPPVVGGSHCNESCHRTEGNWFRSMRWVRSLQVRKRGAGEAIATREMGPATTDKLCYR